MSIRKLISILLSFVFLVGNTILAHSTESNLWKERRKNQLVLAQLPATNPTRFQTTFTPKQSTSIQAFLSQPKNKKTVFHIQDVHQNEEAQTHIAETINQLIQYKQTDLIALEGAFENLNLESVRNFPFREPIRQVAAEMLKENKISGPIQAGLTSPHKIPPFIGIDDKFLYNSHVQAVRNSTHLRTTTQKHLQDAIRENEEKKRKVFSPELKRLDAHILKYHREQISLGEHLSSLKSKVKHTGPEIKKFTDALAVEKSVSFEKADLERTRLLARLSQYLDKSESETLLATSQAFRLGKISQSDFYVSLKKFSEANHVPISSFPNLNSYIKYIHLSESIRAEELFLETKKLEDLLYEESLRTSEERLLVEESKFLVLAQKLIDFSLTREEWNEFNSTAGSARTIDNDLLLPFKNFYQHAESRDAAMAQNLISAMNEYESNAAVLVTGGFHSKGIQQELEKNGIQTISFSPKITKVQVGEQLVYLNAFSQEKTDLEKLFEGEKLFLSKEPFSNSERFHFVHRVGIPLLRSGKMLFKDFQRWASNVVKNLFILSYRNRGPATELEEAIEISGKRSTFKVVYDGEVSIQKQEKSWWDRCKESVYAIFLAGSFEKHIDLRSDFPDQHPWWKSREELRENQNALLFFADVSFRATFLGLGWLASSLLSHYGLLLAPFIFKAADLLTLHISKPFWHNVINATRIFILGGATSSKRSTSLTWNEDSGKTNGINDFPYILRERLSSAATPQQRIATLAGHLNWRYSEIQRRSGINRQTIKAWLKKGAEISYLANLYNVCSAFRIHPVFLLTGLSLEDALKSTNLFLNGQGEVTDGGMLMGQRALLLLMDQRRSIQLLANALGVDESALTVNLKWGTLWNRDRLFEYASILKVHPSEIEFGIKPDPTYNADFSPSGPPHFQKTLAKMIQSKADTLKEDIVRSWGNKISSEIDISLISTRLYLANEGMLERFQHEGLIDEGIKAKLLKNEPLLRSQISFLSSALLRAYEDLNDLFYSAPQYAPYSGYPKTGSTRLTNAFDFLSRGLTRNRIVALANSAPLQMQKLKASLLYSNPEETIKTKEDETKRLIDSYPNFSPVVIRRYVWNYEDAEDKINRAIEIRQKLGEFLDKKWLLPFNHIRKQHMASHEAYLNLIFSGDFTLPEKTLQRLENRKKWIEAYLAKSPPTLFPNLDWTDFLNQIAANLERSEKDNVFKNISDKSVKKKATATFNTKLGELISEAGTWLSEDEERSTRNITEIALAFYSSIGNSRSSLTQDTTVEYIRGFLNRHPTFKNWALNRPAIQKISDENKKVERIAQLYVAPWYEILPGGWRFWNWWQSSLLPWFALTHNNKGDDGHFSWKLFLGRWAGHWLIVYVASAVPLLVTWFFFGFSSTSHWFPITLAALLHPVGHYIHNKWFPLVSLTKKPKKERDYPQLISNAETPQTAQSLEKLFGKNIRVWFSDHLKPWTEQERQTAAEELAKLEAFWNFVEVSTDDFGLALVKYAVANNFLLGSMSLKSFLMDLKKAAPDSKKKNVPIILLPLRTFLHFRLALTDTRFLAYIKETAFSEADPEERMGLIGEYLTTELAFPIDSDNLGQLHTGLPPRLNGTIDRKDIAKTDATLTDFNTIRKALKDQNVQRDIEAERFKNLTSPNKLPALVHIFELRGYSISTDSFAAIHSALPKRISLSIMKTDIRKIESSRKLFKDFRKALKSEQLRPFLEGEKFRSLTTSEDKFVSLVKEIKKFFPHIDTDNLGHLHSLLPDQLVGGTKKEDIQIVMVTLSQWDRIRQMIEDNKQRIKEQFDNLVQNKEGKTGPNGVGLQLSQWLLETIFKDEPTLNKLSPEKIASALPHHLKKNGNGNGQSKKDKINREIYEPFFNEGKGFPYNEPSLSEVRDGNWGMSVRGRFVQADGTLSTFYSLSALAYVPLESPLSTSLLQAQEEFANLPFANKFKATPKEAFHLTLAPIISPQPTPFSQDQIEGAQTKTKELAAILKPFEVLIEGLTIDPNSGRIMAQVYFYPDEKPRRRTITLLTPFQPLSEHEKTQLIAWVTKYRSKTFGTLQVSEAAVVHTSDSFGLTKTDVFSYPLSNGSDNALTLPSTVTFTRWLMKFNFFKKWATIITGARLLEGEAQVVRVAQRLVSLLIEIPLAMIPIFFVWIHDNTKDGTYSRALFWGRMAGHIFLILLPTYGILGFVLNDHIVWKMILAIAAHISGHFVHNFLFPGAALTLPQILPGYVAERRQRQSPTQIKQSLLYWKENIEQSHRMILEGAARVSDKRAVTILGVGDGHDIPLTELARQFHAVHLTDINAEALEQARLSVPVEYRDKIKTHLIDLSGGTIEKMLDEALTIIVTENNPLQANEKLVERSKKARFTIPSDLIENLKATYVISSLVITQLNVIPQRFIEEAFQQKFGIPLRYAPFDGSYFRNIVLQHFELISQLISDNGLAYVSSDMRGYGFTPDLSQAQEDTLTAALQPFFTHSSWSDGIDANIKKAFLLAYSTPEFRHPDVIGSLIQQIVHGMDPLGMPPTTDAIKGLFSLIHGRKLTYEQTMALFDELKNTSRRMGPTFVHRTIPVELEALVPSNLKTASGIQSWNWILRPYLRHIYEIDAMLLENAPRPTSSPLQSAWESWRTDNYDHVSTYWQEHVQRSKQKILEGAEKSSNKDSVTIIGAGECREIPLKELALQFQIVKLVDVDEAAMRKARDALPPALQKKVQIFTIDITNGSVVGLAVRAKAIVETASTEEEANNQIEDLYKKFVPDTDFRDFEELKSSYVISSMVAGHLGILPPQLIRNAREKRGWTSPLKMTQGWAHFQTKLIENHLSLLQTLLRNDNGLIYVSADTERAPNFVRILSENKSAFIQDVMLFLFQSEWALSLAPEIKAALAHFFQETPIDEHSTILDFLNSIMFGSGDEQMTIWKTNLNPQIMGDLQGKKLTLGQSILLMNKLREISEKYNSSSGKKSLLPKPFSEFVPQSLEVNSSSGWLWIQNPLGLQSLTIESFLLKKKNNTAAEEKKNNRRLFNKHYLRFWREHIARSHSLILEGASKIENKDSVTILGAGQCREIPLEELARQFNVVRLVDTNLSMMEMARDALPTELRQKVQIHQLDISGSAADALIEAGMDIVKNSASAEEFEKEFSKQLRLSFETYDIQYLKPFQASYVISSLVASQIAAIPINQVTSMAMKIFGRQIEIRDPEDTAWTKATKQHVKILNDLVKPNGRIYFSADMKLDPFIALLQPTQMTELSIQIIDFIQSSDWARKNDPLIKITLEQLTYSLNGNLTLIFPILIGLILSQDAPEGEGTAHPHKTRINFPFQFSTEESLELLDHIWKICKSMFPNATMPLVPGNLADYFPPGLAPDSPVQTWKWVENPANFHAHTIQAVLLKPEEQKPLLNPAAREHVEQSHPIPPDHLHTQTESGERNAFDQVQSLLKNQRPTSLDLSTAFHPKAGRATLVHVNDRRGLEDLEVILRQKKGDVVAIGSPKMMIKIAEILRQFGTNGRVAAVSLSDLPLAAASGFYFYEDVLNHPHVRDLLEIKRLRENHYSEGELLVISRDTVPFKASEALAKIIGVLINQGDGWIEIGLELLLQSHLETKKGA